LKTTLRRLLRHAPPVYATPPPPLRRHYDADAEPPGCFLFADGLTPPFQLYQSYCFMPTLISFHRRVMPPLPPTRHFNGAITLPPSPSCL